VAGYATRRLGAALLTFAALLIGASLLAAWLGNGCAAAACEGAGAITPVAWLDAALHLDFGTGADNQSVREAIATALPASALLVVPTILINMLCGWGIGALSSVRVGRSSRAGRLLLALLTVCQTVPIFWLGGLLVGICAVWLGWLPPGGIVGLQWPAFGTAAYGDALRAQPLPALTDLLSHMVLPVLTLALATMAVDMRLARAALPPALRARWSTTARASGLAERRIFARATRVAAPNVIAGSAAGAPLFLSALIVVEYLFGWPGVGMLAYHAARGGDGATLSALLVLFGTITIVVVLVADLLAAWADPRLRMERR
jgi:peptide/nickel transport system permease protein